MSASQSNPDNDIRRYQHVTPQTSPSLGPHIHPLQRNNSHDGPGPQPVSLPPLRQLSRTPPTPNSDRRSRNPFGSILNPQADLVEQQRALKRSASQMGSPSPSETQTSHSLPSISRPPSVNSNHEEPAPTKPFGPPPLPLRHMSNIRSPTLHRSQSVNMLGTPTGTIDAHQSPFLGASTRSDPMTSQPALPTPPVGVTRTTYFPSAPTPPPASFPPQLRRPSISFPQSGSASPIASYSPYSQPASVASSQYEGSNQPAYSSSNQHHHHHHHHPGSELSGPLIAMETERNLIPMAPTGQSTIQMMTIKSQQGHQVQIPVDVQAASKVADEKRKRNAGASARFRARRKEKEREASASINRLEQQLRDAAEDVDFYRQERDHFRALVWQSLGGERHHSRAISPRLRRPSIAPSSTRAGSVSSYGDYDEEVDHSESDRNVRRRTSTYHPVSGPPPTHVSDATPPSQSYPATNFPPMNTTLVAGPHLHRTHSNPQFDPREQRPLPELQAPTIQAPGFRDPFPTDTRNWAPSHQPQNDRR